MLIRPWRDTDSIAELTRVVRTCYQRLAEQGFRFLGTFQDDEVTADRVRKAQVWLLVDEQDTIHGTISLEDRQASADLEETFYARPDVRVISQFGVMPDLRGEGWGDKLLATAEQAAREAGATSVMLDTAWPATGLRQYYEARGYHALHQIQWRGPNYASVVMAKNLVEAPVIRLAQNADQEGVVDVIRACFDVYGFTWEEDDYCRDLYTLEASYAPPDAYFWVAEVGGRILGTGAVSFHSKSAATPHLEPDPRPGKTRVAGTDCELHRLYVHPDAQGQGLGRLLLRTVRDQALAHHATEMEIWSDVKLTTAHGIYKRLGAIHQGDRILDDPDDSHEHGFSWNVRNTRGQL